MDWRLFAQLAVTVLVALAGGWLGHSLAARRDLLNERRKLRVTYLLDAYRRLEGAANRNDLSCSWPKLESAIADIQLLGSPVQVGYARGFAREMAYDSTASLDALIDDLRRSLREELQLPEVDEPVVYLRFGQEGIQLFDEMLVVAARDVSDAKAESAAPASPDGRQVLEQGTRLAQPTSTIVLAWNELEELVRRRLDRVGANGVSKLSTARLLDTALQRGAITEVQHRSLRGLSAMRNLAGHGEREIETDRAGEFLILADAMKAVLEITESENM